MKIFQNEIVMETFDLPKLNASINEKRRGYPYAKYFKVRIKF
jgi:hypothetical protein